VEDQVVQLVEIFSMKKAAEVVPEVLFTDLLFQFLQELQFQ
jgi:hypothetical protein